MKYKVGDYVKFNESERSLLSNGKETEVYDSWYDNQIQYVTISGKYIFEDFSGAFDESIISGLSDDQRENPSYSLKNLDVKVSGNLYDDNKINIKLNSVTENYTADEVLGLLNKLTELAAELSTQLVHNRIKQKRMKDES